MLNFKNKKVLITGGSRGIGAACVKYFSSLDADVVFTYQNNYAAAADVKTLCSGRGLIDHIKADISSEKQIISAVKKALSLMGGIDILVNNAGIWKYARADNLTLSEWEETMKINLTAAFLFSREVLSFMKKSKSGKIINISSTAGQRGEAGHSHYAASKGGMISYTKSLALETGKYNINVNCVAPGWVISDMTKNALSGKSKSDIIKDIPLRRIAIPEDIAGAVIFLASDMANHITGEVINVNGGSVLCG